MTPRADVRDRRRPTGHRPGSRTLAALVAAALAVGCSSTAVDDDAPDTPPVATDPPSALQGEDPAEGDDGPAEGERSTGPASPPQDPGPAPEELPAPPSSRAALVGDLAELAQLAEQRAAGMSWGVLVTDELGREVVALRPDEPQLPASTMKQVTAAAVLTTLGADARLVTRVEATGGIDEDGRLDGDLVLRGGGDPTLATEEFGRFVLPARPRASLDDLADQLVDQGLTEVTGDLRGWAPAYEGEPLPMGWPERYLNTFDGRYISGLTVDAGLRIQLRYPQARVRPAPADDEERDEDDLPDEQDLTDLADALDLDEVPTSLADLDPDAIDLTELDTEVLLTLAPTVIRRGVPQVRTELARDPVRHATEELRRLLERRGVTIDGEVVVGPPEGPLLGRLAAVESPPLSELLRYTVQRSDNHLADTLFQLAGRVRTGTGSWLQGQRAMRQVLDRFGIDADGSVFADGSGLSRDDRLTPRQLVELDRVLTGSPRWGTVWRTSLAEMGVSGTLERRLRGTPAQGRFLGKTGTLRDVTALTGQVVADEPATVVGPGNRRYHLAVLATDTDPTNRAVARAFTDELILTLVADLDDCAVRIPDEGDGPLGRAMRTVSC